MYPHRIRFPYHYHMDYDTENALHYKLMFIRVNLIKTSTRIHHLFVLIDLHGTHTLSHIHVYIQPKRAALFVFLPQMMCTDDGPFILLFLFVCYSFTFSSDREEKQTETKLRSSGFDCFSIVFFFSFEMCERI